MAYLLQQEDGQGPISVKEEMRKYQQNNVWNSIWFKTVTKCCLGLSLHK